MKELKKVSATWQCALPIECPNCHHTFDLLDELSKEGDYPEPIYGNFCKTVKDLDFEVYCSECDDFFIIESLHY